ncbi:class I SAM-dependent methyltransferase, partial [Salmonella enterica subsp. enterica serovar Anatum]|nr:class I SAM-dependent methyltransferase [Salmonella enterica subsp. enterica serovar Anatum]
RGEAVAKAVGIKGDYLPDVVDATAGLGRDAFVLASVGCRVRMRWFAPVVALLMVFSLSGCFDKEGDQRKAFVDFLQNTAMRSGE